VNRITPRSVSDGRARSGAGAAETGGTTTRAAAPAAAEGSLPKRVWAEFKKDDISGQAAKVAYYFFLSLPPALMAVFALTGIFGGPAVAARISGELSAVLPAEASGLVDEFVGQVVMDKKPGLLSIGLLLALWSASNVFNAMGDTLNVAYGVEEDRSWVKKKLVALGTMIAVAVLFLAGTTALVAGPAISDALGLGQVGRAVWAVGQWPLAFLLIASAFWIIYYVLPNKDQSDCKKTLFKASEVAAGLWLLATFAFRLYVANFSSYSATYGFIGAVIVLLLWMYVTSLVILLGGEIAAEMER
jgi:membrane protein